MIMKRSLVLLVTLALLLGACAATAPGTTGVVTEVNGNTVSVAVAGGQPTTYTLTNRTLIYAPDGVETSHSYLSKGQRVMVWANGTNAVRVNIEG
jgi:ABC-type uncharacterized transport system YnjBCD substrate-binding protein